MDRILVIVFRYLAAMLLRTAIKHWLLWITTCRKKENHPFLIHPFVGNILACGGIKSSADQRQFEDSVSK